MNYLKIALIFLFFSTVAYGQKYQTGGNSQVFKIMGTDTIFANKTLYENIKSIPKFSSIAKIMELTGAQQEIDALGMCTVFLPTNAAFDQYDQDALKALLRPANSERLKAAFMSHLVNGRVDENSIKRMATNNNGAAVFRSPGAVDPEVTLQNNAVILSVPGAESATLIDANYIHAQGYLHIVDGFLYTESNN